MMNEPKSMFSEKEVEFSELVLGFSSAALHYLGEGTGGMVAGGEKKSESKTTNLALARQNIEIIRMLKTKTAGNLSVEESKLIEGVLTDLMMKAHFAASR